jgi:hypothetical protein
LLSRLRSSPLSSRCQPALVLAPRDEPDRSRVGARTAEVDHLRVGERVEPRRETVDLLRVRLGGGVEERGRSLVVHGLEERLVLRHAERRLVAVQLGNFDIHLGVAFEDAARLIDLDGRALGGRDALIETPPADRGESGPRGEAMAGRKVALQGNGVLEDGIALGKCLDHAHVDSPVRGEPLELVEDGGVGAANGAHVWLQPCRPLRVPLALEKRRRAVTPSSRSGWGRRRAVGPPHRIARCPVP